MPSGDVHRKTDTADDERYDTEAKVAENEKDTCLCNGNERKSLSLCQNFDGR